MRSLLDLAVAIPFSLEAQPQLERVFYHIDREDSYNSFVRHAYRIDVLGVGAVASTASTFSEVI